MLITDRFVFVHVPRTGGTFLSRLAIDHLRVLRHTSHQGVQYLPEEYADLPVFTVIRNPWDWYVSWYHWVMANPEPDSDPEQWAQLFGEGSFDFPTALRAACDFRPDSDYFSVLTDDMFRTEQEHGRHIDVGRFENLREDFVSFLDRYQIPSPGFREAVLSKPPVFFSKRHAYRDYYDDELRDLVAQKSRVVETFGYSF